MITTVTLNASIDKAYYMEETIKNGTVMRPAACRNSAGGKGLNVARIIKLCGEDVKATGFAGGYNGKYLQSLLEKDGIRQDFELVEGETRSCINILDKKYGSTEYLEPGCEITKEEENRFMQKFADRIKDSDVVTLSGSIPKGIGTDIYERIIRIVKEMGKKVILDTSGEMLEKGLTACPDMVKPNQDELELLFHKKIETREDVMECATKLYQQGISNVVISLGADGAMLVCKDGIYQGKPPKVHVVNTVGCGDSMVGAFAVAMKREYSSEKALQFAVAVATANAMSPHTGDFSREVYQDIIDKVKVDKL